MMETKLVESRCAQCDGVGGSTYQSLQSGYALMGRHECVACRGTGKSEPTYANAVAVACQALTEYGELHELAVAALGRAAKAMNVVVDATPAQSTNDRNEASRWAGKLHERAKTVQALGLDSITAFIPHGGRT